MAVARRRAMPSINSVVVSRDAGRQHWLIDNNAPRPGEATPLLRSPGASVRVQSSDWLHDLLFALQRGVDFIFSLHCSEQITVAPLAPLNDSTVRALASWKDRIRNSPYDSSNLVHEQQLLELWRRAFPDEPLEQRVTKQWGKLGFQGKDPATDFRGAGVYSLSNLLHLSERYALFFNSLVASAFPFAITSINLTNVLFELLGHGMRPSPHSHSRLRLTSLIVVDGEVRDQLFSEVYCMLFWCFAEEWRRLNATYLQFPTVLTAARAKFCLALDELHTASEVVSRNARILDADLIRF